MNEFERGVLAALKSIDASLRGLKAPGSPEEGIMAREPNHTPETPQTGAQRLTEDTPVDFEAYIGSLEVSPRLVEKLFNPEGH